MNLTKEEIDTLKVVQSRVMETYLDLYRAEQAHKQAEQQHAAFLHKLQFRREPREAQSA